MNVKKIITLLLAALLVLSLAACGAQGSDSMDAMNQEPKNAKEADVYKRQVHSYVVDYFFQPEEYEKYDYEYVYAITVLFSQKPVSELAN